MIAGTHMVNGFTSLLVAISQTTALEERACMITWSGLLLGPRTVGRHSSKVGMRCGTGRDCLDIVNWGSILDSIDTSDCQAIWTYFNVAIPSRNIYQ